MLKDTGLPLSSQQRLQKFCGSRKTVYNYIAKLSKTKYNYGIIAEVGGWYTIDELKKSYGQIPPEKILEMME